MQTLDRTQIESNGNEVIQEDLDRDTFDWKRELGISEQDELELFIEDDEASDEDEDYQIVRPKLPPLLKIALIGGGLFGVVIVAVIGFFVMQGVLNNQGSNGEASPDDLSQYRDDPILNSSNTDAELLAQISEVDLDKEVAIINDKSDEKKTPPPASRPTPPQSTGRSPAPANRVNVPKVIYRDRPAPKPIPQAVSRPAPAPKAKPRPAPTPAPRPAQPIPSAAIQPAPPVEIDPYEAWDRLAQVGAVGGGDIIASASSTPSAPDVLPAFNPSLYPGNSPASTPESIDLLTPPPASEPEPQIELPLGTVVKGDLMHDIAFENGSPSVDKAVVELKEPLGEIPAGSMVSTQINGVDDSGALSMSILGYEWENTYREISLPQVQVTSAAAKSKRGGFLGGLLNDPLVRGVIGTGLDIVSNETNQNISFNGDGRVTGIQTNTDSGLLDRSISAASSNLLRNNRSVSRTSSRKAPRVKEGSTVRFIVIEPTQ